MLTSLSPPVLLLVLLAGAVVSSEAGYWAGRVAGPRGADFDDQLSVVRGAIFALVAFLIGFAFSGAGSRHVDRLDVIVKEANALGTAWLRADTLPQPARSKLKEALREYTADRLVMLQSDDTREVQRRLAQVPALQDRIWKAGLEGTADSPQLALLVLPSLNDVIDLHTIHLSAAHRHIPAPIVVALLAGAALSLMVAAFGNGQIAKRHSVLNFIYGFILSIALWMTIDLDYPRYGLIRTNIAPLAETLASMKG
ncbi:MAG: hypothetical protein U1E21_09525 [Reyranellaceae bacterium]